MDQKGEIDSPGDKGRQEKLRTTTHWRQETEETIQRESRSV